MEESSRQFREEKIGKLLLKFSIPIVISILVSELYSMVDTIFIGRNVGATGIGALVIVFPIQRIIIALSIMIGIGTSTSFSRSNGENDMEKSRKIIKNGFMRIFSLTSRQEDFLRRFVTCFLNLSYLTFIAKSTH